MNFNSDQSNPNTESAVRQDAALTVARMRKAKRAARSARPVASVLLSAGGLTVERKHQLLAEMDRRSLLKRQRMGM